MERRAIPYGRQSISKLDTDAVLAALQDDFLTQGPKVAEFEQKFAKYVSSEFAVAVSNGTAALHLCTMALGVSPASRVITTPITFAASANCVLYCGGKVEFADINPETALMDIDSVRKMLQAKPKGYYHGLIPVDFAGYPVDLEAYRKLAEEFGLWIIEDACHAPGAHFKDSKGVQHMAGSGKFADLAIFSFHPVKHIATGEGGMITTNNKELYRKLILLRTHGITKDPSLLEKNDGGWYYEMQDLGYNYRIPDILCALGISQLAQTAERLERRKEIARRYDEAFSNREGLKTISNDKALCAQGVSHAYHLYVIRSRKRLGLYNYLKERNIHAQVHYIPVHTMPYYRKHGFADLSLPNAESYYSECLSLPMYPTLTDEEQAFVIKTVLEFQHA